MGISHIVGKMLQDQISFQHCPSEVELVLKGEDRSMIAVLPEAVQKTKLRTSGSVQAKALRAAAESRKAQPSSPPLSQLSQSTDFGRKAEKKPWFWKRWNTKVKNKLKNINLFGGKKDPPLSRRDPSGPSIPPQLRAPSSLTVPAHSALHVATGLPVSKHSTAAPPAQIHQKPDLTQAPTMGFFAGAIEFLLNNVVELGIGGMLFWYFQNSAKPLPQTRSWFFSAKKPKARSWFFKRRLAETRAAVGENSS